MKKLLIMRASVLALFSFIITLSKDHSPAIRVEGVFVRDYVKKSTIVRQPAFFNL
jgi:hypothetical protein